jgi:hypothetical protein
MSKPLRLGTHEHYFAAPHYYSSCGVRAPPGAFFTPVERLWRPRLG